MTDPSVKAEKPQPGDAILDHTSVNACKTERTPPTIVEVTDRGCWAEATQTAYIVPGTILRHERGVSDGDDGEARVGNLLARENAIPLERGDLLILTRDLEPGRPASRDTDGAILTPAMIGCTIPEAFEDVRSRDTIWFDDGKIGGTSE